MFTFFNSVRWWRAGEKKTDPERKSDKKARAPAARDSMGTSKASREQKRQKKARRITRRNT